MKGHHLHSLNMRITFMKTLHKLKVKYSGFLHVYWTSPYSSCNSL